MPGSARRLHRPPGARRASTDGRRSPGEPGQCRPAQPASSAPTREPGAAAGEPHDADARIGAAPGQGARSERHRVAQHRATPAHFRVRQHREPGPRVHRRTSCRAARSLFIFGETVQVHRSTGPRGCDRHRRPRAGLTASRLDLPRCGSPGYGRWSSESRAAGSDGGLRSWYGPCSTTSCRCGRGGSLRLVLVGQQLGLEPQALQVADACRSRGRRCSPCGRAARGSCSRTACRRAGSPWTTW